MTNSQPPSSLQPIVMPKWGLAMEEGTLADWHVAEGAAIEPGQDIADIETSKITNVLEARTGGTVARLVAEEGDVLSCGSLIAVIASGEASDAEIDDFIGGFVVRPPEDEQGEDAPAQFATMTIDDIDLRYADQGSGDAPVLLIHGFGGDLTNWMFVQPALAEQYRVIAVDLPGHGGSSKSLPGDGDLNAFAKLFADFTERLSLDAVHLVGHSFGSAIAAQMALRHPDKIRSLALIAPALPGLSVDESYIRDFLSANRRRELRRVLGRLFFDPTLATPELSDGVARAKRIDGAEAVLAKIGNILMSLAAYDIADTTLIRQALVVWGDEDRIITRPDDPLTATMKTIEGAGHLPQLEKPDAIVAALSAWLDKR